MTDVEIVRAMFGAYRSQDPELAERLLADAFVFTSPQDDHIDKTAYLERCFPTADRFRSQDVLHVVSLGDGRVFVLYEYELEGGERYRNAEVLSVADGRVVETQVFFGGRQD